MLDVDVPIDSDSCVGAYSAVLRQKARYVAFGVNDVLVQPLAFMQSELTAAQWLLPLTPHVAPDGRPLQQVTTQELQLSSSVAISTRDYGYVYKYNYNKIAISIRMRIKKDAHMPRVGAALLYSHDGYCSRCVQHGRRILVARRREPVRYERCSSGGGRG